MKKYIHFKIRTKALLFSSIAILFVISLYNRLEPKLYSDSYGIASERGRIFTSDSVELARDTVFYSLFFDCLADGKNPDVKQLQALSDSLASLTGKQQETFMSILKPAVLENKRYVRLASRLDSTKRRRLENFPLRRGLILEDQLTRVYASDAPAIIGKISYTWGANPPNGLEAAYGDMIEAKRKTINRYYIAYSSLFPQRLDWFLFEERIHKLLYTQQKTAPARTDLFTTLSLKIQKEKTHLLDSLLRRKGADWGCLLSMDREQAGAIKACVNMGKIGSEYIVEWYNFAVSSMLPVDSTSELFFLHNYDFKLDMPFNSYTNAYGPQPLSYTYYISPLQLLYILASVYSEGKMTPYFAAYGIDKGRKTGISIPGAHIAEDYWAMNILRDYLFNRQYMQRKEFRLKTEDGKNIAIDFVVSNSTYDLIVLLY